MTDAAGDLPLHVSWFSQAVLEGVPALGDPETISWANFCGVFWWRREGEKDGPNFVPARFKLETDRRRVRRLKANLLARTAIALDIETSKSTGEVPPSLDAALARSAAMGWACLGYTSHSHTSHDVRYRMIFPLSAEIGHELPAPEVIAAALDVLGVLDRSKIGAASLFYLPSAPYGGLDVHRTALLNGASVDAAWMRDRAGALLAARQADAERLAAEAHAEAAERRAAKIAAGFDPDDSLIEKLRSRFDLGDLLTAHGYARQGTKYRHPNSSSGSFGADIKTFGGIERLFSHNGTDPLHADNLPAWCGKVSALDAFDVVAILDFGGDRTRAMRELAQRFGLSKSTERKELAALIFRMLRRHWSPEEIEAAAVAEGDRLGLSRSEVSDVASWVDTHREAA